MLALLRLLAGAALSLALAGAAQASGGGLASAQAALASGDYRSAYAAYRKEAQRSALAQFTLGMFLREGWGMARDPAAACKWFEKAAAGRVPAAAHFWGDCLAEGIGTAADIPRALSAFGQLESHLSRRFEGTGLGLTLAKSLTEMHGGTLAIESEVEVGTLVTVALPAGRVLPMSEL